MHILPPIPKAMPKAHGSDDYPTQIPREVIIRWSGEFTASATGEAFFRLQAGGSARLYLDGKHVLYARGLSAAYYAAFDLVAHKSYKFEIWACM